MLRLRLIIIIVLSLVGAGASGLLLLQHHREPRAVAAVSQVCGEGAEGAPSGCEAVAASRYSSIGGFPLAALGLLFYTSIGVWALLAVLAGDAAHRPAAVPILAALALALVFDVVLLGIQAFAIHQFCKLCLLTYAVNAIGLLVLLPARQDRPLLRGLFARQEGRLALAGWVLASVALATGLAAAEVALDAREHQRAVSLFGVGDAPTRATSPITPAQRPSDGGSPRAPLSEADRYREDARMAQEQARRLQEILDDPKKLDQYFSDKAMHEFETAPVRAFNLNGVPFKGPADSKLNVVTYSDFLCPFCKQLALGFSAFLPTTGNRLALYYKHYPLESTCNVNVKQTVHAGACLLAAGGICANDQGHFWPYHERVFGTDLKAPSMDDVVGLGVAAGAERTAFQTCMTSAATRDRLTAEIAEGKDAGVVATPAIYLNGKSVPRPQDFVAMVDKEAARLGLPPLPKPPAPAH